MTEFNRYRIKGETYFFTLALHDWPPELLADHIKALCATLLEIKRKHHFSIDALVILPKHLSCILTLPKNGRDFSLRWRLIKSELSSRIAIVEQRVLTPQARHEGRTRQQGFWECALRDDSDFARHMDYLTARSSKAWSNKWPIGRIRLFFNMLNRVFITCHGGRMIQRRGMFSFLTLPDRRPTMKSNQQGMTLIELSVVLLVLVALAGIAIPYIGGTGRMAMCRATDATMQAVKEAIMGGAAGAGYYGDMLGEYPKATKGLTTPDYSLSYLFVKPESWNEYNLKTGVGWRGPYLQNGGLLSTESAGHLDNSFDAYHATVNPNGKAHIDHHANSISQVFDAWHRPLIIQVPATCSLSSNSSDCARIVSAGPGRGVEPEDAEIDTAIIDEGAESRIDDRVLFLKIPDPKPGGNMPCDQI